MITNILLGLMVIMLFLIAFFLFAIWRAILGKSSVDMKLATSVTLQTKKMGDLTKALGDYSGEQVTLSKTINEAVQLLKSFRSEEKS